ncbi:MAG TPA: hypothetical protein VMK42_05060 [Anaeromyxobacteraceae bacterium]|nr:hypothetical protein [Anaeromyxobacteraceae bacterium]
MALLSAGMAVAQVPEPSAQAPAAVQSVESSAGGPPSVAAQLELKRAMTDRAATDQRSQWTLRTNVLLDSPVSLVRLDIPFVDKNNSFSSDPANVGLGDLKTRVGFAPIPVPAVPLSFFFDFIFPTGGSLGNGKYQLCPGLSSAIRLASWRTPVFRFLPLVEQYVSIAGDPNRSDIDYTSFELKVEALWPKALALSMNAKPVIDWVHGAQSAAVLDSQVDWIASTHWRVWVKYGFRLWGARLPTTYDGQLEIGVRWSS